MGYEVIHTAIEAQTAKDADRPQLQAILAMASKKQIQAIIVVKLDRLSRDVEDSARIGKMLAKKGVSLHLVSEGGLVDLSDPSQEMLFHMRSSMALFERKRISLNTKFALARKKEMGKKVGKDAPFGYMFLDDNVVVNAEEQNVITKVKSLHNSGVSLRKIIGKLDAAGHKNRNGNSFHLASIQRMVAA